MHLVFLGIVSKPTELHLLPNSSVAGNKMQFNLLKHLSLRYDVRIDVVSFQNSSRLFVKGHDELIFDGKCHIWQVGYLNIPFLKQILLPIITYRKARALVKKSDVIMSYDIYPTQGIPLTLLKKRVNGRTVCLLADLSIGGVSTEKGVRRILRKLFDKNSLSNLRRCENLIVLNENVIKKYSLLTNYCIMDGGIEPSDFVDYGYHWDGSVKNIVYTGALVEYSGIMNLLKSMDYLKNSSIVLDIYGDGTLKNDIERLSHLSSRVRYYGKVSNEEAIKAQQTAWLLINPRPVENEIAKVTFPSKIFEYLMSGRPVITTRLNGFSSDYDSLLFWAGIGSPIELASAINRVDSCTEEQLQLMAKNAKEYLLKNKTWKNNASQVYSFLKNLY